MRAQANMEYMILVVISITSAVLMGSFPLTGNLMGSGCSSLGTYKDFDKAVILDFSVTGSDSPYAPNNFYIVLTGRTNDILQVKELKLYQGEKLCGEAVIKAWFSIDSKTQVILGGNLRKECTGPIGSCYRFDVVFKYDARPMGHSERGWISGQYESQRTFYSLSFGSTIRGWARSSYSSGILTNENNTRIGSFNNSCPAVLPSDTSGFISASSYESWPVEPYCSPGGGGPPWDSGPNDVHQAGFDKAYCIRNATYNNHGWLATNLYIDQIYAGHKIFLVGNGSYSGQNKSFSNAICINDNYYFYVNGQLINKGGTTGYRDIEAFYGCSNCANSDSWCIPPVELTDTSAFRFGQNNTIMVLLEEYCLGGGVTPFEFFMA